MTATVHDLRQERALRVFRDRLRSDTAALLLVSCVEARRSDLERCAELVQAGYSLAEARAVLEQLGYVQRAETCTRCAYCRRALPPKTRAVYEPRTNRAWCDAACHRATRRIAAKER